LLNYLQTKQITRFEGKNPWDGTSSPNHHHNLPRGFMAGWDLIGAESRDDAAGGHAATLPNRAS
jgi:hypothetical protein